MHMHIMIHAIVMSVLSFFKHLQDRRFNICGISYGLMLHSPKCLCCLWRAMR